MKIHQLPRVALGILKAKLFDIPQIIAIRWQITPNCVCRCPFCENWKADHPEPSWDMVKKLLWEMKEMGVINLSISGGEPLLYKYLPETVDLAQDLGMDPTINTCGFNFSKMAPKLRKLKLVKISLDGPKEVHDSIRKRPGCFDDALSAADACEKWSIPYSFACTMTKYTLPHLEYLRKIAEDRGTFMAFQPVENICQKNENIDDISPSIKDMKKATKYLYNGKKNKLPGIRNTQLGLKHIRNWPHYYPVPCAAGRLFAIIDIDGSISPCDRVPYENSPSVYKLGLKKAIKKMHPPRMCEGCGFLGSLELSYLLAGRIDGISLPAAFSLKK